MNNQENPVSEFLQRKEVIPPSVSGTSTQPAPDAEPSPQMVASIIELTDAINCLVDQRERAQEDGLLYQAAARTFLKELVRPTPKIITGVAMVARGITMLAEEAQPLVRALMKKVTPELIHDIRQFQDRRGALTAAQVDDTTRQIKAMLAYSPQGD